MDYILGGEEFFKKISATMKFLFMPSAENNFQPGFLRDKFLFYCLFFLIILKIINIAVFINFPINVFFAELAKTSLVNLVNEGRKAIGLPTLTENEKLNQAAYLKAEDMLKNDYFSHQGPQGVTPWFWFKLAGYDYKYAGENLAIGFLESGEVYNAWFNSISHRNNLLNPNYGEIGTAVLKGDFNGNSATVVVQLFGSPQTAKATSDKKPTGAFQSADKETQGKNIIAGSSEDTEINKEILPRPAEIFPPEKLAPLFYGYDEITKYVAFGFLVLIALTLLFNIFINPGAQNKNLILRSFIFIIVFYFIAFLDREAIIKIIPHQIII